MMKEVEAGAELGVDVIQIDDGWQKGRSANSAALSKGEKGRWGSWWDLEGFWDVDPGRFPRGLEPVVASAREKGMKFGLWFGPDSTDEAKYWSKDADFLLSMHRRYGIDYFKLDSMKTLTPLALERQTMLMDRLMDESESRITIDLDATTVAAWKPLVERWKAVRPDSLRELSDRADFSLDLTGMVKTSGLTTRLLGGAGTADLSDGVLKVRVPGRLGFIWVSLDKEEKDIK